MSEAVRAYCPRCKGCLLGGEWFQGRVCGTCHGETIPEDDAPPEGEAPPLEPGVVADLLALD